ncbi:polyprenyl synthetase [Halobacterium bonnevillei]|uniref:polyprenyl synthetase n=1 Tax=Halobacterium bonnevillei TaxID=2692200 RepID=UPI001916931D|nr:polyprenyl synthetase [Halobacterium bonnevillei]
MTESAPGRPAQIDRHIERVLSDTDEVGLPLVRDVLPESSDRWYGLLVVAVYESLADSRDTEIVLPAAAAIELLRGYVRLRSRLLVRLADNHAHSLTTDRTSSLLAGDYLYTAAFSALPTLSDTPSGDCFAVLTSVLETITDAFARTYAAAESTDHDQAMLVDDTAGSLGEGAALLGAVLAGIEGPNRRDVARFGRGLSTARQSARILDADPSEAIVVPPRFDETQLRALADRRRDDANRALDALPETVDVARLRAFVASDEPTRDPTDQATDGDALE